MLDTDPLERMGGLLRPQDSRPEEEESLNFMVGSRSVRVALGNGGSNLRRLMESLQRAQNEPAAIGDAIAEAQRILDAVRNWMHVLDRHARTTVDDEVLRMVADYSPCGERLRNLLPDYLAVLQRGDLLGARHQMAAIAEEMCAVKELHQHYQQLLEKV